MKNPADSLSSVRLTPCPRTWESLEPDPEGASWRSCDACQLQVHDVAALHEDEAQELIRERDSRLCLRVLRRPDGTVVTREDPPSARRFGWARRIAAAASWLMLCLGLAPGCDPQSCASGEPSGEHPGSGGELSEDDVQQLMLLGYVSEALGGIAE
jgi:hypothetical protein